MNTPWITTGLPYANGTLHAGHLYEWLIADSYTRLSAQCRHPIAWVCGDDAHGVAVANSARRAGLAAGEWVDRLTQERKSQLTRWGLHPAHYGSTHDPDHYARVQSAYEVLHAQNLIVDVECLQYHVNGQLLFERDVQGQCPHCQTPAQHLGSCDVCGGLIEAGQLVKPVNPLTGEPVGLHSCRLAHFRWGLFREQIKDWLLHHAWPEGVQEKLLHDLQALPELWCIERSGEYFGVPIPHREGHFYVWFDALLGYGTFAQKAGCALTTAPIHIIGKDILTFHALRWPALCLALDEPLPEKLLIHGHLVDAQRGKLSKSKGNAPDLNELIAAHGLDILRLDWVGQSKGTSADITLDPTRLQEQQKVLARRLGNTYRRLFNLVDPQKTCNVPDQVRLALEQAQHAALSNGDFSQLKEVCFNTLDELNGAITQQRWWEQKGSDTCQTGWAILLAVIEALYPLLPLSTQKVVDKLHANAALEVDDLFF